MRVFILMVGLALMSLSCSTQTYLEPNTLESVIQKQEFRFNATKAFPTNAQVLGAINATPGGSSRLLNLDPGYGFVLNKDLFEVNLPYFGRAYSAPYNSTEGGIRFSSKDFSVDQTKSKKGNTLFVIKPKDNSLDYVFNLEVFKNGSAFVSISSNNKQPISFDGNLTTLDF